MFSKPGPINHDPRRVRVCGFHVRLTARARDVTLGERSARLVSAVVRRALRFPLRNDTIAVELDPDILRATLLRPLAVNERPPTDARLEIRGNRVAVIPAKLGRRLKITIRNSRLSPTPLV